MSLENPFGPMSIGITVVVPSYNHGEFVGEAIRSITAQNYPAIQILVQDGGSTDTTLDVLRNGVPVQVHHAAGHAGKTLTG